MYILYVVPAAGDLVDQINGSGDHESQGRVAHSVAHGDNGVQRAEDQGELNAGAHGRADVIGSITHGGEVAQELTDQAQQHNLGEDDHSAQDRSHDRVGSQVTSYVHEGEAGNAVNTGGDSGGSNQGNKADAAEERVHGSGYQQGPEGKEEGHLFG